MKEDAGPDYVFGCFPAIVNLCRPCRNDDECFHVADHGARCLDFGDDGSFCAPSCQSYYGCPEGYTCTELQDEWEQKIEHCLPDSGFCECKPRFVAVDAATDCYVTNEHGSCTGERSCTDQLELTGCNAAVPGPEVCDGADNDCDGEADEEGAEGCTGGWWADEDGDGFGGEKLGCLCELPGQPAPQGGDCADNVAAVNPSVAEVCDGIDNNCDGETDEGFEDADQSGLPDCCEPLGDCAGAADCQDCLPCTVDACALGMGLCMHEPVACGPGSACGEYGLCECSPDCAEKECGDDGCSGSCGMCGQDLACLSGLCVETDDHGIGFDGTKSPKRWVEFANPAALDWSEEATIEAWVRVDIYAKHGRLFKNTSFSCTAVKHPDDEESTNRWRCAESAGQEGYAYSAELMTFGVWQHVAFQLSDGCWQLYVDGQLNDEAASATGQVPWSKTDEFIVGADPGPGYASIKGVVDEVRVSSVARYDGGFEPPLVMKVDEHTLSLHRFNEGTGNHSADASENGYTATLINAPEWVSLPAP